MQRLFFLLALIALPALPAHAQFRSQAVFAPSKPDLSAITITESSPLLRHLTVDCDLDRTRGREAASSTHNGSGWMLGGLASGVLLGLIGTAITYAIASSSTPEVSRVPEGVEAACYRDGYVSRAKSMNTTNALTGGLIGTAVLVLIIVSASSGSTY